MVVGIEDSEVSSISAFNSSVLVSASEHVTNSSIFAFNSAVLVSASEHVTNSSASEPEEPSAFASHAKSIETSLVPLIISSTISNSLASVTHTVALLPMSSSLVARLMALMSDAVLFPFFGPITNSLSATRLPCNSRYLK